MSKSKKILLVVLVVGAIVANYVIIIGIWPAISSMLGIAQADPQLTGNHATDFRWYTSFLGSMPWILFILPAILGVVEVVLILKATEYVRQRYIAQ